jgi:hypothetical protein
MGALIQAFIAGVIGYFIADFGINIGPGLEFFKFLATAGSFAGYALGLGMSKTISKVWVIGALVICFISIVGYKIIALQNFAGLLIVIVLAVLLTAGFGAFFFLAALGRGLFGQAEN